MSVIMYFIHDNRLR